MARPPKYDNAEDFAKKVDEYFTWCDSQLRIVETDKGTKFIAKPYTVSGLCLYLDICRDTLCEYEKIEMFSDTVKRAKYKIENWIEEKSLQGELNPTVSIFNLKNNFGWKDKQEVESSNKNVNINYDIPATVEELKAKIAELDKE